MKRKVEKKLGICYGSIGIGALGFARLGYFRHINILWFILYSVVLCNFSHIHSEAFSFARGFFPQGFPRKSGVFFFVFVFHYCVIDYNKWY